MMLNRLFGNRFASSSDSNVHVVPAAEIQQWVAAGEAVLIDVREPNEYAAEAIRGALNLPLSSFDPAKLPTIPEGRKLVIHCRSGQRCGMAASRLVASGYTGPINRMEGGIMGWRAAGGPTQRGT